MSARRRRGPLSVADLIHGDYSANPEWHRLSQLYVGLKAASLALNSVGWQVEDEEFGPGFWDMLNETECALDEKAKKIEAKINVLEGRTDEGH